MCEPSTEKAGANKFPKKGFSTHSPPGTEE